MKNNNKKPKLLFGIGEINFGKQYRQGNRVYSSNDIAMCLTAQPLCNLGGMSYLYLVKKWFVLIAIKNNRMNFFYIK